MKRGKAYGSCRAMVNPNYKEVIELSRFHQIPVESLFVFFQIAEPFVSINSVVKFNANIKISTSFPIVNSRKRCSQSPMIKLETILLELSSAFACM